MSREERRRHAVWSRVRRELDAFYSEQSVREDYSARAAVEKVLELAMRELEFTGGRRANRALIVMNTDPGGGASRLEVSAGWQSGDEDDYSRTVVREVIRTGEPVLIADAVEDARFSDVESLKHIRALSILAIPLRMQDATVGALYVDSADLLESFSDDDVEFLSGFAQVISPHLKSAFLHQHHLSEIRRLRGELGTSSGFASIIGRSAVMESMFHLARRVAEDGSIRVLIRGESGTGKELVARGIHREGPRASKPFVTVNCAAIPRDLLESELFGHERGAFTGAVERRMGRFEEADGGTLFLDEIGDMDLALQAKLLRVLEEGVFERLGGRTTRVNVRVLAATHRNLQSRIAEGLFREDLYHRLNVVMLTVPPLRDRPEDIPLLVQHFVERLNRQKGTRVRGFSATALEKLCGVSWPGNVRQLENLVERCHLLCDGVWMDASLLPSDLEGSRMSSPASAADEGLLVPSMTLRQLNRIYARRIVDRVPTRREAARILGVTDKTLKRLLEEEESGTTNPHVHGSQ